MSFGECKVYNDGSHYIAIPYVPNPRKKKWKPPEEMIVVKEHDYGIYLKKVRAIEEILKNCPQFQEQLCSVLDKQDVGIQKTYCLK